MNLHETKPLLDSPEPPPKPERKARTMTQTIAQERQRPPTHETRAFDTYGDSADVHIAEGTPWVRPTSLEAPPARPGFSQRWIRVGTLGQDDPTNAARKFREGWKPRLAETVPSTYHSPSISHGKWAGCVGVEGMLLCEMPTKLRDKRNKHYQAKTDLVSDTIQEELQNQSHRDMPITQERKTRVMRNARIKDDE